MVGTNPAIDERALEATMWRVFADATQRNLGVTPEELLGTAKKAARGGRRLTAIELSVLSLCPASRRPAT